MTRTNTHDFPLFRRGLINKGVADVYTPQRRFKKLAATFDTWRGANSLSVLVNSKIQDGAAIWPS